MGGFNSSRGSSSGSFNKSATFDDRANPLIAGLTSQSQQGGQDNAFLSSMLRNFLNAGTGQDFTNQALATGREASQQGLNNNLAQVRSQGNRGGIARDVMNQAGTVANFEQQLNANDAAARLGQFNAGRQQQLGAADLLRGLTSGASGNAINLINLLRGEQGTQTGQQSQSGFSLDFEKLLGGLGGI